MKKTILLLLIVVALITLMGCGYVEPGNIQAEVSDFWDGIWHGMVAPYTLIVRIFKDVGMYAIPNTGWWYDFGFILGVTGAIPLGWLAALISFFL